MNKSTNKLLAAFFIVIIFSTFEIIYYSIDFAENNLLFEKKRKAAALVKLPDLALASETIWIRHRSIANVFSIFPEDGTLLDYYPSSFVYNIHFYKNQINAGKVK
ncbi:MAG: hypothetical protein IPH62_08425 [Ignavibacteriae bacterium]|nr:hypothetical protein [Ignavibacteriota bacterium]